MPENMPISTTNKEDNKEFYTYLVDKTFLRYIGNPDDHEGDRPTLGGIKIGDFYYYFPETSGVKKAKNEWKFDDKGKIKFHGSNNVQDSVFVHHNDEGEIILKLDLRKMFPLSEKQIERLEKYELYTNLDDYKIGEVLEKLYNSFKELTNIDLSILIKKGVDGCLKEGRLVYLQEKDMKKLENYKTNIIDPFLKTLEKNDKIQVASLKAISSYIEAYAKIGNTAYTVAGKNVDKLFQNFKKILENVGKINFKLKRAQQQKEFISEMQNNNIEKTDLYKKVHNYLKIKEVIFKSRENRIRLLDGDLNFDDFDDREKNLIIKKYITEVAEEINRVDLSEDEKNSLLIKLKMILGEQVNSLIENTKKRLNMKKEGKNTKNIDITLDNEIKNLSVEKKSNLFNQYRDMLVNGLSQSINIIPESDFQRKNVGAYGAEVNIIPVKAGGKTQTGESQQPMVNQKKLTNDI